MRQDLNPDICRGHQTGQLRFPDRRMKDLIVQPFGLSVLLQSRFQPSIADQHQLNLIPAAAFQFSHGTEHRAQSN